jgi:hypothetical protein
MNKELAFNLKSIRFDENYQPSDSTRITTNFANLARGTSRQQNLRNTLRMIDNRFNDLAHWDNPTGDRYAVELEIISVEMSLDAESGNASFPLIEILKTSILDKKTNKRIDGIAETSTRYWVPSTNRTNCPRPTSTSPRWGCRFVSSCRPMALRPWLSISMATCWATTRASS